MLIGLSADLSLNRQDYGIAWKHCEVPLFVGDEIGIQIRLISRQTERQSQESATD